MIDHQNMQGEKYCADKYEKISLSHRKTVFDTEKIQPGKSQHDGSPDKRAAFFSEKESDNGNDHNVAGGNESGLAHCGIFDPELLKITGKTKKNPAGASSCDEDAELRSSLLCGNFLLFLSSVQKPDNRKEHRRADQVSGGVESESSYIIHAHALGYESHAPYGGGEKQDQRIFQFDL